MPVRKTIMIPKILYDTPISIKAFMSFFDELHNNYEWDLQIENGYNFNYDYDIILAVKCPQKELKDTDIIDFSKLSKDTFLILYLQDFHEYKYFRYDTNGWFLNSFFNYLERADLILSPYSFIFKTLWGEFKNKIKFFPYWVSNELINEISFNDNPITKCTLTGQLNDYYPERCKLKDKLYNKSWFTFLDPPSWNTEKSNMSMFKIGIDYYNYLNTYLCSIATPSVLLYTIYKYYEIPACGALLLGMNTEELSLIGLEPNIHYVRFNERNDIELIEHIIHNPNNYTQIRFNGFNFIRENYNIPETIKRFSKILYETIN
jgi:hypothetical protein